MGKWTNTSNKPWVTDISYTRTHEAWLYLAVMLDLYLRKVIGWSMQSRIKKELVLNVSLMVAWRRKPTNPARVNSDRGSQYTSHDWQAFLKTHGLEASMSRYKIAMTTRRPRASFGYSSVSRFGDPSMEPGTTLEQKYLISSRSFTTVEGGMDLMKCFRL